MSIPVEARELTVGYGEQMVIKDLNVHFPAGKITTILGPNGCGKSTLLRALSRLIPAKSGKILVDNRDVTTMKRKELAKLIGFLPQSPVAPEGLKVADLVARGRHPHQSWINQWSRSDEKAVFNALQMTDSIDLADRTIDSLSGGQRQRVWISMVLAQETEILFLDEPTTYLDLSHSIEVLNLVRHLKNTINRTVIMVVHDLNLALRYSDNLILIKDGAIEAAGTPAEVITPESLHTIFNLEALVLEDPAVGGPLIVPAAPK